MYLGIDLGTSEVKALLIDEAQRIVASAHAPLTIARPQPLWSEQRPADWWHATRRDSGSTSGRTGGAARLGLLASDAAL